MKSFTDKYINETEALKTAVVGFEFEFYCDKPYYILLTLLNKELNPIKVHGFRKYHSSYVPDENNFKIESDASGGNQMIELVTGPMPYVNARIILLKILKFLQTHCITNEKSGIHINISFQDDNDGDSDKLIDQVNPLKIILNCDEDMIYRMFPDRKNNYYAKSIKRLIPFKGFNYASEASNILQQNIEISTNSRYFGANLKNVFSNRRLEFRYIGGRDYQFKTKDILDLMDYFIVLSWNSIDPVLTDEEKDKLQEYLTDNIANFKNFSSYENFVAEFPSIQLEIDKDDNMITVKSYYSDFYNELYDIISNIYNLNNCIINYDTDGKRLEIVDASFKTIFDINNVRFIECTIVEGEYSGCLFSSCDVKNAQIYESKILSSYIANSKLENCQTDSASELRNVYIYGGMTDGNVISGIIRSGKLGDNCILGDDVEIYNDEENYFGIENNDVEKSGKKNKKTPTFSKDMKF